MDALHVVELNFTDFNVQSTSEDCLNGFVMVSVKPTAMKLCSFSVVSTLIL